MQFGDGQVLPKTVGRGFVGLQGFVISVWDPYGQPQWGHCWLHGFCVLSPPQYSPGTAQCPTAHPKAWSISMHAIPHPLPCSIPSWGWGRGGGGEEEGKT